MSLINDAKKLLDQSCLVIRGREYIIEAFSVHDDSDILLTTGLQKQLTWHISFYDPKNHQVNRYIDVDISTPTEYRRLRLNAIKDKKSGRLIGGAGKLFMELRNILGDDLLRTYNEERINKSTTPELYLKKLDSKLDREYFIVPRELANQPNQEIMIERIGSHLRPLMVTSRFEWLNKNYIQRKIISLYFYTQYGGKMQKGLYSQKELEKYKKYLEEGFKSNFNEIIAKYKQDNKHTKFALRYFGKKYGLD